MNASRTDFCIETYNDALEMSDEEIDINIRENVAFLTANCDWLSTEGVQTVAKEMRAFRFARADRAAH